MSTPTPRIDLKRLSGSTRRRILRLSGWTGAFILALYLLRWPLLESVLRHKIQKIASEALHADLTFDRLEGNLISSVRGRGVVLHPRPGSPLRAARIEAVDVRYGLLGLSGLHLAARDARIEWAPPGTPSAPVHETVRDALKEIQSFAFPGELEVEEATVILPGGQEVSIDQARFQKGVLSARLHIAGSGEVDLEAHLRGRNSFWLEGRAATGPLRWARVDLAASTTADHPLRIEVNVMGEPLHWAGTARMDADGRVERLTGALHAPQGKVATRVDLGSGAFDLDLDGRYRLLQEFGGELIAQGRIHGSLAEPIASWVLTDGWIRASGATWKGLPLAGEVRFSGSTLERIPWHGSLSREGDRLAAEGIVFWKGRFGLDADVTLDVENLTSYRSVLLPDVPMKADDLHLEGRVDYGPPGAVFEGSFRMGPGAIARVSWDSVRWTGRMSRGQLDARELTVQGLPGASVVSLSGSARVAQPGPDSRPPTVDFEIAVRTLIPTLPIGPATDVRIRGRLDERGLDLGMLEGRLDHGRFRAIGRWDFRLAERPLALHLIGDNLLVLSEKLDRVRISPNAWVKWRSSKGWTLEGSLEIPSALYYGELGAPAGARPEEVKTAAAPKIRLPLAPGGGIRSPLGIQGGEGVALDLDLRTVRELRIENSMLGTLAEAELHVGGTLAAPTLSGEVRTRQGELRLATGVFIRIERAEVTVPREPGKGGTVYFKGRSGKGQGAITVVVAGPLENPALTLSSDPPQKQEDLLAYLAFGRLPGTVTGQEALGTALVKVIGAATDRWPQAEPQDQGFWERLNFSVASEDAPDPEKRLPW
jgi:hypothetical protein